MTSTTTLSTDTFQTLADALGSARLEKNASLAPHTWMKVGGPADALFIAKTSEELHLAVKTAIELNIPYFILGGGSNLVIKDKGIRGLVIKNRTDKISLEGIKGSAKSGQATIETAHLKVDSGVIFNRLVRHCIDESLAGLEEFLGIPGTVGGAVYNNSHHLTHLIGDYIEKVEVIDTSGHLKIYTHDQLAFAYDYSILQKTKEVILTATFRLTPGDKNLLWQKAEAALKRRRDTQPLGLPSSGCMFQNIKLSEALIRNTPNHTTSAGFLIDKAGLKGTKVGGAQISDMHANFIVNTGQATAADILKLKNFVKTTIKDRFGVTLKEEVFFIGES